MNRRTPHKILGLAVAILLSTYGIGWSVLTFYLQSDFKGRWIFTFTDEAIDSTSGASVTFLEQVANLPRTWSLDLGIDADGRILSAGQSTDTVPTWYVITTDGTTQSEIKLDNAATGQFYGALVLQDAPPGGALKNIRTITINGNATGGNLARMEETRNQLTGFSQKSPPPPPATSVTDYAWKDDVGFKGSFVALKISNNPDSAGKADSSGCFLRSLVP
jgi:hypothetical protein